MFRNYWFIFCFRETKCPSSQEKIPADVQNFWDAAEKEKRSLWNVLLDDINKGIYTKIFEEGYAKLTKMMKGLSIKFTLYK